MKKIKLKKTLKSFQLIDVVDVLDCLIMCYVQADIKELSKETKEAHTTIAQLLRKDINKAIPRPIKCAPQMVKVPCPT